MPVLSAVSFMAQFEVAPLVAVPVVMSWVEPRVESVKTVLPSVSSVKPIA